MKILNMDAFAGATFNHEPWDWGVLRDLLSKQDATRIRAEIMELDFHAVAANRADKSYRMGLTEIGADFSASARLGDLLCDVRSDAYVEALENYAHAELRSKRRTLNIWKYSPQDYLSPHVDKPEKYLTHLFYFNDDWPPECGGSLNILSNSEEAGAVASIVPQYRNSAVIKTTARSWHSVSPVSAHGTERYCLQLVFWND